MKFYFIGFMVLASAFVTVTFVRRHADGHGGSGTLVSQPPAVPTFRDSRRGRDTTLAGPEALGMTERSPSEAILGESDESESDSPILAPSDLEEAEVFALEQSFEALHFDSTRGQLLEAYEAAVGRVPSEQVQALHARLLDLGQVEVLDAKATTTPEGHQVFTVPRPVRRQNRPVLSMTHYLADGTMNRTWIEPSDMPAFEQDIRYANWLMDRIRGQ
jgi:hypothetical protein